MGKAEAKVKTSEREHFVFFVYDYAKGNWLKNLTVEILRRISIEKVSYEKDSPEWYPIIL